MLVQANDIRCVLEAQLVAVGLGLQAVTDQPAGADQHQAVDQFGGAIGCTGAIDVDQRLLFGFLQVGGDGWAITRSAGDQRIERGAPRVHRVRNEFDLLNGDLRSVVHGGGPQAATCSTESFMPSWMAMLWEVPRRPLNWPLITM